jgi:ketosteroid isomerase-like protein
MVSQASDPRAAVIRAMLAAIDRHDLAALAAHPGLYETVEKIPSLLVAFPDLKNTIEQQFVAGDIVVTRAMMRGTHRGPFMGVAPTGTRIEAMVLMLDTVVDGKIVLNYALPDWLATLVPIGALPAFDTDPV